MFQNSYQNGSYFDLFDPKTSADKLKTLLKTSNIPVNAKVFDKDLKTFVIESMNPNAKMQFPKQDKKDLYLIQQYLVFQIYFFPGMSWSIELTLSDLNKTKRRVILSPATTKLEIKPFFVKGPCHGWKEGIWNTFVVNLYTFMEAFKGQTYRSLDAITISGHFKLRRIYTTSTEPYNEEMSQFTEQVKPLNLLPKQFYYPMGVQHMTFINKYETDNVSQAPSQITDHSTKNSSFLKSSKAKSIQKYPQVKIEQDRTSKSKQKKYEPQKMQEIKSQQMIRNESQEKKVKVQNKRKSDFLANTNGQLIGRKKQKLTLDANASSQKVNLPKTRPKGKVNPWRNNKESRQLSDGSNLAVSKHEAGRKAVTPDTNGIFKKVKADSSSEFLQTKKSKQNPQSDSQYFELSQKFSTVTEGKFFKREPSGHLQNKLEEDEIQQNIQMETNSMCEGSASRLKQSAHKEYLDAQIIKESINDSLDGLASRDQNKKMQQLGRSSLYGFGENLMRNFMHDIERPYSPPIGQRQAHQQQSSCRVPEQKEEVQLMFDPILNCFYDYRTHTYYQLKN